MKKLKLKTNIIHKIFFILCLSFASLNAVACDSTPVLTISNVTDIGGGFFTADIQVCIGDGGSESGFTTSFGGGINITAFTPPTLVDNNTATGSLAGGILDYDFAAGVAPGNMFVNEFTGTCFNFTVTVDADPVGQTVTFVGVNSQHPGSCSSITGNTQTTTIPGPPLPCIVDFTFTAPNTQAGNTTGAGDNCPNRSSEDQTLEVIIPCDETWTFSLCGNSTWDTYLYLSNTCCGPTISSNDDACGLQSEITQFLTAGTYYITVEAFGASSGTYILDVTSANPCTACTYTVGAGLDATICAGDSATMAGTSGGGVITTTWTTPGDGFFVNPAILNAVYVPGAADIAAGTVTLTITTDDPAGVCTAETEDMILTINPLEDATFNYSAANYCQSDTDPIPTITGTVGGTFTSSPAGLNINAATGTIDVSLSTAGTYGVLYTTPGTCTDTLTVFVTVNADEDATFNYSAAAYCQNDPDPTPTITGTGGGTFTSSPAGLNLTAGTGFIDISASTAGTYGVLYTTPGPLCQDTLTVFVTINANETATFNYSAAAYCQGDPDPTSTITGTPGGTFTSSPAGLNITAGTGLIDLSASTPGFYGVLYTTPSVNCQDTLTVFVTVNADEDATFNYSAAAYCQGDPDPTPTITGTVGGTFTSSPAGLSITAGTGLIDVSASTPGTYGVLYTTPGPLCQDTLTVFVTVNANDNATFNYSLASYCQVAADPTPTITGTPGGTFTSSPAGLSITAGTGLIDLSASTPGTYGVLYTTPSVNCQDTLTVFVAVLASEDATFNYSAAAYCVNNSDPTPTITGTPGGTFTSTPAGLNINAATGMIDLSASTSGTTYSVFYTTPGTCFDILTVFVTVNALPTVVANASSIILCDGDPVALTGSGANTYIWDNSVVDGVSFNPNSTTIYTVTGTDINNCVNIDQIMVTVNSLPTIDLGNDTTICGDTIIISPGAGFSSYLWQDGSTNSSFMLDSAGYFSVTVTDAQGCLAFDDIQFFKDCPYTLWIPNAFTPDNDGVNDFFSAKGEYLESYTMNIYNRWGENIFSTNSLSIGWDGTTKSGTMAQEGVYVYRIEFSYFNRFNLIQDKRSGKINLVK